MSPMTDDGQLLHQYVANHSEPAFAELVRRHANPVYFTALRRLNGDRHAAADVAQEVFILLSRRAWTLSGHPTLTGWLYSTVNFRTSAWIRSAQRRQLWEQKASAEQEAEFQSNPRVEGELLRPILDEALLSLGKIDREVVLLRFFTGLPFAELSAKLGLSEAAAQMRSTRALQKLHVFLGKRGLASTTAALALTLSIQARNPVSAELVARSHKKSSLPPGAVARSPLVFFIL
jgi:RNA polymerase sigma factor (sigma-70 family)